MLRHATEYLAVSKVNIQAHNTGRSFSLAEQPFAVSLGYHVNIIHFCVHVSACAAEPAAERRYHLFLVALHRVVDASVVTASRPLAAISANSVK